MTVNIEQIQRGAISFIENEIASKATGLRKFMIYFAMPSLSSRIPDYISKLKSLTPQVFDTNGNVLIDDVYNMAKSAVQKTGSFEFMDIIFDEMDVDKLYSYIKRI